MRSYWIAWSKSSERFFLWRKAAALAKEAGYPSIQVMLNEHNRWEDQMEDIVAETLERLEARVKGKPSSHLERVK